MAFDWLSAGMKKLLDANNVEAQSGFECTSIINSLDIMLDRWQDHKTTSEFLKDTVTVTSVNTHAWTLAKGMMMTVPC